MPNVGYKKDYRVYPKAQYILKNAIRASGVNVHKPFNLYLITKEIEAQVTQSKLDRIGLATTSEVIKSIEFMKDNRLI